MKTITSILVGAITWISWTNGNEAPIITVIAMWSFLASLKK